MVTWNRFDICEAYYVYAMLWHKGQWSTEYQIFGRLARMRFRIAIGAIDENDLSENGRAIYDSLVDRKGLNIRDLDETETGY